MNEHFSEEQLKNAKATLPNTEFQDEVLKEYGAKLSPEVCKAIIDCGDTIYEMDVELTKEQQTLLDEPLLVSMEAKEERGAKLSPEVCKAIKDGAYVSMELGSCYASPKIVKAEFYMPVTYQNVKITPAFTGSTTKQEKKPVPVETQAQYLDRIKAMKIASVGTGIRTMLPPKPTLTKPEVEELEAR